MRSVVTGRYPELAGARVTVLDKLTYAGSRANLDPVRPHLELVVGDILDRSLVDALLAATDLVVHFAAESHVDRSIVAAGDFVRTNVLGTQTLLDAALRAGPSGIRFVHVSTDEVYGSIEHGAWDELQPLEPNSPYSASKAGSDLIARAYAQTYGLDVVVTRSSNNYGAYQFPEKLIPLFVTNLMDGHRVPLYGDGLQVRDWLHVDDHCRGVALVATGGRAGEVYNIGGGTGLTNRELTQLLLDACGVGWERVRTVEDRRGHDRRYCVDFGKIRAELGYEPLTSLEVGLGETVRWYAAHRAWWEPLKSR
ncbi:dTDP-glucose 4,6-dehydratase [Kineosporia babensis]|uniref:dTDP-glucose 4,6-dehydratase n=1 Tax=Kineosporia babensis TaxID=499548 RepID=A0A9X1N8S5_9ACTN|nr:dTDP-glucose 4,6-dehydratase [Kineosporia babensis]